MRNFLTLLASLVAGSTCYAQTTNSFPASGNAALNTNVPAAHVASGYHALWMPNGSALMPENGSDWASIGLTSNILRTSNNMWGFINSTQSAWRLNIGNGNFNEGFSINRSSPGTYSEKVLFRINNAGKVGIGTNTPEANLHIMGSGDGSAQLVLHDQTNNSGIELRSGTNGCQYIDFTPKATNVSTPDLAGRIVYNYPLDNGFCFYTNTTSLGMAIDKNGSVGIGTSDPKGYKLAVAGKMVAEEVNVKLQSAWPDFVFKRTYKLPSLTEVKEYIDKNKHLPDMPSEQEVAKQGISLGEMNRILVKKMEEMTLYMIQLKKENDATRIAQRKEISLLKKNIKSLKK